MIILLLSRILKLLFLILCIWSWLLGNNVYIYNSMNYSFKVDNIKYNKLVSSWWIPSGCRHDIHYLEIAYIAKVLNGQQEWYTEMYSSSCNLQVVLTSLWSLGQLQSCPFPMQKPNSQSDIIYKVIDDTYSHSVYQSMLYVNLWDIVVSSFPFFFLQFDGYSTNRSFLNALH